MESVGQSTAAHQGFKGDGELLGDPGREASCGQESPGAISLMTLQSQGSSGIREHKSAIPQTLERTSTHHDLFRDSGSQSD